MNKEFSEESAIFTDIVKWLVLSSLAGACIGALVALFLKVLNWSTQSTTHFPYYFLFLPLGLWASAFIRRRFAGNEEGLGSEIKAVHKHSGKVKAMPVAAKLVAAIITIASGGSAGKEGPSAEIGAALSSKAADMLRLNDYDRKKLAICGISAGLAAVFGAPVSGALFGIEVLAVGVILYDVLLPAFVAGVTAYHVSAAMGVQYFSHRMNVVPVFSELFLMKVVLAGIFFGICSFFLIKVLHAIKGGFNKVKVAPETKALAGGVILVLMTLLFSKDYLGLGLDTTEACLLGQKVVWYAFLLKIIYTSITFASGGCGGIVTPIFFIGATAGSCFATFLGLDQATFAALGALAVMAGAANTPIAASVMAAELFGMELIPYAAVVSVVSFFMTGHRSVYPYQLLQIKKAPSLDVELGEEIERAGVDCGQRSGKNSVSFLESRWCRTIREFVASGKGK